MKMNSELTAADLKLIKIFMTVVKHQGFANAQQELSLSTSAISTYMSTLETKLGVRLSVRGRGGFFLTEQGQLFYQQAQKLFNSIHYFEQNVANLNDQIRGKFHLGILDAVDDNSLALSSIIGKFSNKYPEVNLYLTVSTPYDLQLAVLDNQLDAAIGFFPTKMNGLSYYHLCLEQQWLYCGDKHPLFRLENPSSAQINEQKMAECSYLSSKTSMQHGIKQAHAFVEAMEAKLWLILSGSYLGYLPAHYANNLVAEGKLRQLNPLEFGYQSEFALITRTARNKELLISSFKQIVHNNFDED